MTLLNIIVFSVVALALAWIPKGKLRYHLLLISSIFSIFWLQPLSTIRNFDFWLPVASLVLTITVWRATQSRSKLSLNGILVDAMIVMGSVFVVGITRYLGPFCCLTATRPPQLQLVILLAVIPVGLIIGLPKIPKRRIPIIIGATLLLVIIFIALKYPPLTRKTSIILRGFTNQDSSLALITDLPWLGYSYLAFRLIHTLRDRLAGLLPDVSLGEFITYVVFFPTLTAGPIDRIERFVKDLRFSGTIQFENLIVGGRKIIFGIFKKFVLADNFAIFALNTQHAADTDSTFWMWILLYAYTLRIYFDFSGYTDIALGLGSILGFNLPDNFSAPYTKTNLTSFWNSWHITLTYWFRSYFFNPLIRALRVRASNLPAWFVTLLGQIGTMSLIGLWHGVTYNFLIWGLWHAVGLFIHNRWTNWLRSRSINLTNNIKSESITAFLGWVLTFNYVALGWVWFALPNFQDSMKVFATLFGATP